MNFEQQAVATVSTEEKPKEESEKLLENKNEEVLETTPDLSVEDGAKEESKDNGELSKEELNGIKPEDFPMTYSIQKWKGNPEKIVQFAPSGKTFIYPYEERFLKQLQSDRYTENMIPQTALEHLATVLDIRNDDTRIREEELLEKIKEVPAKQEELPESTLLPTSIANPVAQPQKQSFFSKVRGIFR